MPDTTLVETSPEDAGLYPDQIEQIRERAREWARDENTEGLVLLAARNGRIALFEAFDPDGPGRDLAMPVASITKVVTATAIMVLVEAGELSLNRLVREFVPELRGKYTERILVHQLLTHTSGFASLTVPPIFIAPKQTDIPCPQGQHAFIHRQLQMLFEMDCHKKPGTENMYCDENFLLLGEIVRRVSGQDIGRFALGCIFEPLGMGRSTYGPFDEVDPPRLHLDPSALPFPGTFEEFANTPQGAVSLKSCAMDLARFGQCFLNGGTYNGHRLLNPGTVEMMTTNRIPGIGGYTPLNLHVPEGSWGLGWMVQGPDRWPWSHGILQPEGTFYHQGATGSGLWVDRRNGVVGVYLSRVRRDMSDPNPHWEFDKYQNMVTAAVDHDR